MLNSVGTVDSCVIFPCELRHLGRLDLNAPMILHYEPNWGVAACIVSACGGTIGAPPVTTDRMGKHLSVLLCNYCVAPCLQLVEAVTVACSICDWGSTVPALGAS